jgi:hypothetical protein
MPMGAWGGGLYDGDFALDLKGTIKAVLRAPLSDDEVLAELWTSLGKGAGDMDALDYWVVLADQLERLGLRRPEVFERAIAIVEAGEDVAMLKELDADPKTIAERQRETAKLLPRLRDPRPAKKRRPLKAPEPLLLERGEALTWPTDGGNSINPYVPEDQLWKLGGFKQDGWGFGMVAEAGHHYHVLAYYAVQVLKWRRPERPTPELAIHCPRADYHYGTINKVRLARTKAERLGPVPDAAIGPAPPPNEANRRARRAVLRDLGLSSAFGLDAWNTWGGVKFAHPAPSGTPLDPDEPDQRPEPKKS